MLAPLPFDPLLADRPRLLHFLAQSKCFCFPSKLILHLEFVPHPLNADSEPECFVRSRRCSFLPWVKHFFWNLPRTKHTRHLCAAFTFQGPLTLAWWLIHATLKAFCTYFPRSLSLSSWSSLHFWIQEASLVSWQAASICQPNSSDQPRSSSAALASDHHAYLRAYSSPIRLLARAVTALPGISQWSHSSRRFTSTGSLWSCWHLHHACWC